MIKKGGNYVNDRIPLFVDLFLSKIVAEIVAEGIIKRHKKGLNF